MGKKYVFVDWSNVEAGYGTLWPGKTDAMMAPWGIALKVHRPRIDPKPVIKPEMDWEAHCINCYATFLQEEDKIKVWYEAVPPRIEGENIDMSSLLCYAESEDGIHFTRPDLGIYNFRGNVHNNIVKNVHGVSVIRDDRAAAEERYKMIYTIYRDKPGGGHVSHVHGAVSPDGLHWTDVEEIILDNPSDTQNILTVDETGEYAIYTRQIRGYKKRRRSISVSKSRDFRHFPKPTMLLNSDPCDPPDWDYYTNGYLRWPGAEDAHLMLIDMYHRTKDTFDVHLATSSDGMIWYRPLGREAYLANGEIGEYNCMTVSSTYGIVDNKNGTWSFYIMTSPRGHNDDLEAYPWLPYGGYWKADIRADGFLSIAAEERGGFHTIPLKFTDGELKVNAGIPSHGFVKFGIFDMETQTQVEGFTTEDCDPLDRHKVWQSVTWKGNGDLSRFCEGKKTYRLCVEMFKSDLYAIQV